MDPLDPDQIVLRWIGPDGHVHSASFDYAEFCLAAGRILQPHLKRRKGLGVHPADGDGDPDERIRGFVSRLVAEAAISVTP